MQIADRFLIDEIGEESDGSADVSHDAMGSTGVSIAQMTELERQQARARGAAFHLVMQHISESGVWEIPPKEHLSRDTRQFGLDASQYQRVRDAVARTLISGAVVRACKAHTVIAEMPFGFPIGESSRAGEVNGEREADEAQTDDFFYLEGSIDLYCREDEGHVFIVDYKTGGLTDETPKTLLEKHGLQARCYALAALRAGATRVDLSFVHVETRGTDGLPQEVSFSYGIEQCTRIEDELLALRRLQLAAQSKAAQSDATQGVDSGSRIPLRS